MVRLRREEGKSLLRQFCHPTEVFSRSEERTEGQKHNIGSAVELYRRYFNLEDRFDQPLHY